MKKKRIKQLIAVASTLICIGLLDYGVGIFFDCMLKKLPDEGERVAKSNYVISRVEADILVIGSSRAESHYDSRIIHEYYPDKTIYNCGMDDQGFYYQVAVINCILDRYTPKMLIWDFQHDEFENTGISNLSLLYPYYYNNEYVHCFLDEMIPSLKYKIWLNSYRYNGTAARILKAQHQTIKDNSDRMGFGGHESVNNSVQLSADTLTIEDYPINTRRFELFMQTVNRLKDTGVEIVIVESPLYDIYMGTSSTIKTLQKESKNGQFVFIDDSQMPELLGKTDYMYDRKHLNNIGARIFTKHLCEQLFDMQ